MTTNVSTNEGLWGNSLSDNDALDEVYDDIGNNPPLFNILWITDPLIDYAYNVTGSKTCDDEACCHADL